MRIFTGTRYEMGYALGAALAPRVRQAIEECYTSPPPVQDLRCVLLAATKLAESRYPLVVEELRGAADGARVRFLDLMFAMYEELWDSEEMESGCTDILAEGHATLEGRTLLGHNNDEDMDSGPPMVLRLAPSDGPVVTGVSSDGLRFAVGVNDSGLVLTGNQVTARDLQVGIPRLVLFRAALDERALDDAAGVLADPERTSSYNNILADTSGRVLCLEGSGERIRELPPTPSGVLTHTNHYLHPDMQEVEGKGDFYSTVLRDNRACTLMEQQAGRHTLETLAGVLRDHVGYPDSICRHGGGAVTKFSVLFEPEDRRFWYVPGCPCEGTYRPLDY